MTTPRKKVNLFIIIAPGLESVALNELKEVLPNLSKESYNIVSGGIELNIDPIIAYQLNLKLKIPNRILLRLDQFKCRDFPKLFNKMANFKWNDYLIGQIPTIKCQTKTSRLIHSGRIETTILKAIDKYYKSQTPSKKTFENISNRFNNQLPPIIIYLRLVDDMATLSIDLSGERLGRRTGLKHTLNAPLRENLASALIQFTLNNSHHEINTLWDPFCGSGTFIHEAVSLHIDNHRRVYAFEAFPQYQQIEKNSQIQIKKSKLKHFIGSDVDIKAIDISKKNIDQKITTNIDFILADFFKQTIDLVRPTVIITNPPYGKRLKNKFNLHDFLLKLDCYKEVKMAGILLPKEYFIKFKLPTNWKFVGKLKFKNGGIDTVYQLIKKN